MSSGKTQILAPVLAFDTSLNGCAVCVVAGDGRVATRLFPTDREQAAQLVPLINEAMAEAGVTFADLKLIVTAIGPGSFTGLRIGLSTARAFGLALGLPVQGVGTLAAMAATARKIGDTKNMLVLLETKRSDFYVQSFDADGIALDAPICSSLDDILARDLSDVIFCGDALERFVNEAAEKGQDFASADMRAHRLLNPQLLAELGAGLFTQAGGVAQKPEPLYLRGADVSISTKPRREIGDSPL